jgi:hypothetical protein
MSVSYWQHPPSSVVSLTEDILLEIFYNLQCISKCSSKYRLPMAVVLSHVTRQWREFVINAPLLWTHIQVTTSLQLDALRTIISRSSGCELDVCFLSLASPLGSTPDYRLRESLRLRDRASILSPHSQRWQRLRITADRRSMQYIMNSVVHVSFPRLRSLELKIMPGYNHMSISQFGPIHFNPDVFATLHLHQVVVRPVHPSHLSGLTSIHLSETSCSIIDQRYMTALCNIPTTSISTDIPSMTHLTHLTISSPTSSLPTLLSFTPSKLTSVTLRNLRCTSPLQRTAFINILGVVVTACLEKLVLASIDSGSWDAFLIFLRANERAVHGSTENRSGFLALKRLTLQSLVLRGIDQRFAAAFPNIEYLSLVDLDPSSVFSLLREDESTRLLWRELEISVEESIENPPLSVPH